MFGYVFGLVYVMYYIIQKCVISKKIKRVCVISFKESEFECEFIQIVCDLCVCIIQVVSIECKCIIQIVCCVEWYW